MPGCDDRTAIERLREGNVARTARKRKRDVALMPFSRFGLPAGRITRHQAQIRGPGYASRKTANESEPILWPCLACGSGDKQFVRDSADSQLTEILGDFGSAICYFTFNLPKCFINEYNV